jgi:hypothetical protein
MSLHMIYDKWMISTFYRMLIKFLSVGSSARLLARSRVTAGVGLGEEDSAHSGGSAWLLFIEGSDW